MTGDFQVFGLTHQLILASTVGLGWTLGHWARGRDRAATFLRRFLGLFLIGNEIVWYIWRYSTEGFRFPEGLPLQLCDLLVWFTAIAALIRNQWAFEFAYFAGLAGAGMALLTPDLWAPWPSYPSIYYFLVHSLIMTTILFLLWARLAQPRPGCLWRVFAVVNAYAALMGCFNWIFGTNYMYLCAKPKAASVLDWFGPWPVYIFIGELFALLLFALLWLPWWWRKPPSVVTAR